MPNPTRALEAICAAGEVVGPVTLGELSLGNAAVLEKIGSPLMAEKPKLEKLRVLDLLPTAYVLAVDPAESMRALSRGREEFDAAVVAWAAKIPAGLGQELGAAVGRIFARVAAVSPTGGPEGNGRAATAG